VTLMVDPEVTSQCGVHQTRKGTFGCLDSVSEGSAALCYSAGNEKSVSACTRIWKAPV